MKLEIVNKESQVVGEVELKSPSRGSKNTGVLFNRVVRAMLMNKRQGTVSTKTRGEVSGGGRKPWRQKGTGRARAGSIRSPLFVGGGVVFGPKPRDYDLKINRKEKRLAFSEAIMRRAKNGDIVVIDQLDFEQPKTKEARKLLDKLNIDRALVILEKGMKNAYLSLRNIRGIEIKNIDSLNVYDVLKSKKILLPASLVEKINRRMIDG